MALIYYSSVALTFTVRHQVPPWTWDRVPPGPGTGYPPGQSSTASTCYAEGGVPLAFTQEDFLVSIIFNDTSIADVIRALTVD